MKTPRGKTPSLLSGSNGRPNQVDALRARKCSRCSASITKGDVCYEIPKTNAAFASNKTVCIACFKLILDQTRKELEAIAVELVEIMAN